MGSCRSSRKYSAAVLNEKAASDETHQYAITVALLSGAVRAALSSAFGAEVADKADALIFPGKAGFGDYQCNVAMPLAKKLKMKPRDIADAVMKQLEQDPPIIAAAPGGTAVLKSMDITGPGFINLHLSQDYVKAKLSSMVAPKSEAAATVVAVGMDSRERESEAVSRLGISKVRSPQKIIVDYSSPNIAKEMHVGHLRSTIIGDCLSNVLEFLGHDVLRLNHVGDWGTQFGMLIHYLKTHHSEALAADSTADGVSLQRLGVEIKDLAQFYKAAKKSFDADPDFQEAARQEVVRLQAGDVDSVRAWQSICEMSRREFQLIYDRLGIRNLQERGESFYNPMLRPLVERLSKQRGEGEGACAERSEGALCVFLEGYVNSDGTPLPLIIEKSDGGFLYATTDLAALQHRVREEGAERIIYVTDAGQAQHFNMVFAAARKAGIIPTADNSDCLQLTHVPFGLVQGEDGKKIKSRAGDSIKLGELLDYAVLRAEAQFSERAVQQQRTVDEAMAKEDTVTAAEVDGIAVDTVNEEQKSLKEQARIMGIGAVKYADLSMNRESNYKFSFDKMLSLSGNTAPYMLYAYVRILGIQRKAAQQTQQAAAITTTAFVLQEAEELSLAKHLIRFEEVVHEVAKDLYPNKLCDYIFELSQRFNQFYERCPVVKADTPELLASRAELCALTADTLKTSLSLLGIETVTKL